MFNLTTSAGPRPHGGELQARTDALAQCLDRAIAIDDHNLHLLAHGPHTGRIDRVRRASILLRESPAQVRDWMEALGVPSAVGAVRMRRNAALGMEARICIPLHYADLLVGYLWITDEREDLDDAKVMVAEETAAAIAAAIHRERIGLEGARDRKQELVRDLLADEEHRRRKAATQLLKEGLVKPATTSVVLTVEE